MIILGFPSLSIRTFVFNSSNHLIFIFFTDFFSSGLHHPAAFEYHNNHPVIQNTAHHVHAQPQHYHHAPAEEIVYGHPHQESVSEHGGIITTDHYSNKHADFAYGPTTTVAPYHNDHDDHADHGQYSLSQYVAPTPTAHPDHNEHYAHNQYVTPTAHPEHHDHYAHAHSQYAAPTPQSDQHDHYAHSQYVTPAAQPEHHDHYAHSQYAAPTPHSNVQTYAAPLVYHKYEQYYGNYGGHGESAQQDDHQGKFRFLPFFTRVSKAFLCEEKFIRF